MQKTVINQQQERPDQRLTISSIIQNAGGTPIGSNRYENRSTIVCIPKTICKLLNINKGDLASWDVLSLDDNTLSMKITHAGDLSNV